MIEGVDAKKFIGRQEAQTCRLVLLRTVGHFDLRLAPVPTLHGGR